jgi:hypothetical protein
MDVVRIKRNKYNKRKMVEESPEKGECLWMVILN